MQVILMVRIKNTSVKDSNLLSSTINSDVKMSEKMEWSLHEEY